MRRARFARPGLLALQEKAWGIEIDERGGQADRGFTEDGDAAIVDISGPLMKRAEGFWSLFCDDYESILERARAAFESGARRVILRIDSPGGDAPGCFELARELRALSASSGKQLVAYADGLMCSAAYAIACAATHIASAPTSYVGSIGVFEAMVDWTAQTAAMGLKVVVVSSGEYKTDRNPDVPITDDAIARVQGQVDQFAGLFFDVVAELRGGSADQYRALKGGVFLGAGALGVGLVDAVSAWSELITSPSTEIPSMATAKKSLDAAKEALRSIVDDDKCSEEERDKARKSLRALEEEPKKEEKKEGEGDASADDEQKKKDDEAKAKAAEEEKKNEEAKAKALAENSVEMARELQELKAANARRDQAEAQERESRARAELFAKRPDFSDAQRKTLASVSLESLQDAVKNWPRASATPTASANALTPGVSGGEPVKAAYVPRLTADEQALLDKCEERPRGPKHAVTQGNVLQMPAHITQDEARERLEAIDKELGR